jgi:large subunit ribosomal protein L25
VKFIALETEKRENKGKAIAKALRREEKIPGVVYGKNTDSFSVAVNSRELEKAVKETDTMEVFLELNTGSDKYQVMLKELQVDIINGKYIHADFLTIEENQEIDFRVPVEIVGEAACPGIVEGGMLQTLRRELDVRCTVANMPESIKVDISELGPGESVHIFDVDLGENVQIFTEVNFTIATIVAPAASADAEEGEDEEAEAGSE